MDFNQASLAYSAFLASPAYSAFLENKNQANFSSLICDQIKNQITETAISDPNLDDHKRKIYEVIAEELNLTVSTGQGEINAAARRIKQKLKEENKFNWKEALEIAESEHVSPQEKKDIKQKMHYYQKMEAKNLVKTINYSSQIISVASSKVFSTSTFLKQLREPCLLAEKYHCSLEELTPQKLADLNMLELVEQETRSKKKKMTDSASKVERKGQKTQTQRPDKKKLREKVEASEKGSQKHLINQSVNEQAFLTSDQKVNIGLRFFKTLKCPELSRVTRWSTTSISDIRLFSDRNPLGEQIFRYAQMSENDILIQRARHYLPGTERLLTDPSFRAIYAFPTKRGYGLAAQLFFNGHKEVGILYVGLEKTNHIFHKYFEVKSPEEENIFLQKEEVFLEENKPLENWVSQENPFSLDVSSEGALNFTYSETHAIEIFPIYLDGLQNFQ